MENMIKILNIPYWSFLVKLVWMNNCYLYYIYLIIYKVYLGSNFSLMQVWLKPNKTFLFTFLCLGPLSFSYADFEHKIVQFLSSAFGFHKQS